jgi:predicted dinucleotide-binding enzyme
MRIGILGSGLMGGKLGTIFARVGHEVVFSTRGTGRSWSSWRGTLEEPRERAHRERQHTMLMPSCSRCTGRA